MFLITGRLPREIISKMSLRCEAFEALQFRCRSEIYTFICALYEVQ
jgi:hypothetical protein